MLAAGLSRFSKIEKDTRGAIYAVARLEGGADEAK
jgi:hypothetical protein